MQGRCLCGSVTLTAADHSEIDVCHCDMCRRWAGGPAFVIGFKVSELVIEGREHITDYSSSDWADRGFCKRCGTHLYYRMKTDGFHTIGAGLFTASQDMIVTKQIFIDEKPAHYDLANETPVMTGQEVFEAYPLPN
ncbi:MAG: GFA family protein [Asticcacaulis sp.]